MILKNCTFFNELFEKEFGDIKIENGKIVEIGYFDADGKDMQGKIIIPGFVDIHIHGGNGGDFSDANEKSIDKISSYLAKYGVTSFCGTTMTLPQEKLKKIATIAAEYKSKNSKLIGINLEGPYIAMSKKGAQNGNYIRSGSIAEFEELTKLSNNKIKLITIAPETFSSKDFIEFASKTATVAIGHSNANANECQTAVNNGASHATHLYNAMTPMHHRDAGIVGTMLDNDFVTCELICDGHHICPTVLRNTFDILGENRACVISDSMRGAGLGKGEYELGGQPVFVAEGDNVARLEDGTIAASISNIYNEFLNLLNFGIDFKIALKSCTINPSKAIKEDANIGSISVGKCADLVVLDENLKILEVYINGTLA